MADLAYRTSLAAGKLDAAHLEFEPDMRTAQPGLHTHLVAHVRLELTSQLWLAQMHLSRQLVLVDGDLDFGTWTILNGMIHRDEAGRPHIILDEVSRTFERKQTTLAKIPLVELCSGFGFGSQGADTAGFHTVLKVDKQANTIAALRQQREHALHGDVQHPLTVLKILETLGTTCPFSLLCFACQPFSQFGDQKGMRDERAGSLRGGLTYLMHAIGLIMENVAPTFRHPEVITLLNQLRVLQDWAQSQTTLDLQQQWSSAKERTWVTLLPAWLPVQLQAWPRPCRTKPNLMGMPLHLIASDRFR